MSEKSYHGRIGNSGAQQVKAVYPCDGSAKPKAASHAGNGASSGFTAENKKK